MTEIDERPTYCRIVAVKPNEYGRRGHTLIGWRQRNRLYYRTAIGVLVPVSAHVTVAAMFRYMERGRLYLLTNGIY